MVRAGAVVAERLGAVVAEKDRTSVAYLVHQRAGSATASSRCSGAMRLAMTQASSRSRTWISAPRPLSEAAITLRRGMVGSSFSILAATRVMKSASGLKRIDCAS